MSAFTRCSRAGPHDVPLVGREDAREDVERDERLLRLGVTVDGERDPDPAEDQLRFAAAVVEDAGGNVGEPARQLDVDGAHAPAAATG